VTGHAPGDARGKEDRFNCINVNQDGDVRSEAEMGVITKKRLGERTSGGGGIAGRFSSNIQNI
jgi:hypothetical protein